MLRNRRIILLASALSGTLLGACDTITKVERNIANDRHLAETSFAAAQQPAPVATVAPIRVESGIWLGGHGVRMKHGDPLPMALERPNAITITDPNHLRLTELAELIARESGLPVRVNTSAPGQGAGGAVAALDDPAAAAIVSAANGGAPPAPGDYSTTGGATAWRGPALPVKYRGPLSAVLDQIATRYGVDWEYRDGAVRIFRYQTRTFTLFALATSDSVDFDMDAANSSDSTSSSSTEGTAMSTSAGATSSKANIDIWKEVEGAINAMLPAPGIAALSPATGTITVTTTADVMPTIAKYVDQQNDRLARQVTLDVQVLALTLNDAETYAFDLNLVFKNLKADGQNSMLDLALMGATQAVNTAAGSVSVAIANAPPGSSTANWNGSQAVIRALSQRGNVSELIRAPTTTLNNQAAPVNVLQQIGYLKRVSTTVTDATATTSLEPGVIRTGYSMSLLPRILSGGRVLLQVAIGLSQLDDLKTETSGGQTIRTPDISTQTTLNKVILRHGSTLVLAGFQQLARTLDQTNTTSPLNWFVSGGGVNARDRTKYLIILITPRILSTEPFPEDAAGLLNSGGPA